MRKRSVQWSVALALACGVMVSGCKKNESTESGAEPSAAATTAMASEPTPAPSLTTQVAGAQLSGPGGVSGVVTFTQAEGGVHVVARVEHVKAGQHGFHLHAAGVCDAPGFKGAGDHFNPTHAPHGAPDAATHHAGDFGNIEVGADGTGNLDLTSSMLSVDDGPNGVLGKAVVLHAGTDDLKSQPAGSSGDRIACGVVTRAKGEAEATPVAAATPSPGDMPASPPPSPNGAVH
jgi:Cu-Zn family superoxide dismutase